MSLSLATNLLPTEEENYSMPALHSLLSFLFLLLLPELSLTLSYSTTLRQPSSNSTAPSRRFVNIAPRVSAGDLRFYRRTPSAIRARWLRTLRSSLTNPLPVNITPSFPFATSGQPGVAVGDFNGDGFDDIYVTNGPNTPNSLFINQYPLTNVVSFRDAGRNSGAAATGQDSTGVCYGDLNRDGRNDLVVVSEYSANRIFLSTSTPGRFRELSWKRATGDDKLYPSSGCAIGDINEDGWLDIVVANGVPRRESAACLVVAFEKSAPNQVFVSRGMRRGSGSRLMFEDWTLRSGVNDIGGSIPAGKFTLSWSAALVDVNMDGHLDLVVTDDQCGLATTRMARIRGIPGGADRGGLRVMYGNGRGQFRSTTVRPVDAARNNREIGGENWMAVGFGDFNCDGRMDIFGSNSGDYHAVQYDLFMGRTPMRNFGLYSSRWWLGRRNESFRDASLRETGATVFGWGTAVCDYDNDGDQDIVMVGSLEFSAFAGSDNPNVIYQNQGCGARFRYDLNALAPTGTTRAYQGLALGDFNQDGYPDLVGAASFKTKPSQRRLIANFSSPLDSTAYFTRLMRRTRDGSAWVWTGNTLERGDMMVQMNRPARSGRCWVSLQPVGMRDIVDRAKVNRGGLGAVLKVTPRGMRPVLVPIGSGESFGSQHSPRRNFGLGRRCAGVVEVLWPGGVRNRLYGLRSEEVIRLPEIPCSYDGQWETEARYTSCVMNAVSRMIARGVIEEVLGGRLMESARRARLEFRARISGM